MRCRSALQARWRNIWGNALLATKNHPGHQTSSSDYNRSGYSIIWTNRENILQVPGSKSGLAALQPELGLALQHKQVGRYSCESCWIRNQQSEMGYKIISSHQSISWLRAGHYSPSLPPPPSPHLPPHLLHNSYPTQVLAIQSIQNYG